MEEGADGENAGACSPWNRRSAAPRAHRPTIAAVHLRTDLHKGREGSEGREHEER